MQQNSLANMRTAWDLLNDRSPDCITTFCERLDQILGGGVKLGQLTEVVGAAGVGKTQICFQLAVDCQIPEVLGGVDGQTLYIDTEGTFKTNRLDSIAQAAVDQCRMNAKTSEHATAAGTMSKEKIFARIHYEKCSDVTELLKLVYRLEDFVQNRNIKLIIVDSVTFPFRYTSEKYVEAPEPRLKISLEQARDQHRLKFKLLQVALKYKVAVVLTNHVTTRFDKSGKGYECAALSVNFGSDCATRLLLKTIHGVRWARLTKTACIQNGRLMAPFWVNEFGVRDVAKGAAGATQHDLEAAGNMSNFGSQSQPVEGDEDFSDEDIFGARD